MKLIFSFLFLFQIAIGSVPIASKVSWDDGILNPEFTPGKFVLYLNGYEDLRFDLDLDGKIDFWRLRKDGLLIETRFTGTDVSELFVRKVHHKADLVTEVLYRGLSGKLILEFAYERPMIKMNFSGKECPTSADGLKAQLETYKGFEDLITKDLAKALIDSSCQKKLGPSAQNSLSSAIISILSGRDPLTSCFARPDFKVNIAAANISPEILETSYKLERAKLTKDTLKFKPMVSCIEGDERRKSISYATNERGLITISAPEDVKNSQINKSALQHEFLHRLGYYSEEKIDQIMSVCSGNALKIDTEKDANLVRASASGVQPTSTDIGNKAVDETVKSGDAKIPVPDSKPTSTAKNAEVRSPATAEVAKVSDKTVTTEKYQGSVNAAASSTANIPKTLTASQAQIPSSESLSQPIYSNPQKTPAGIETAYRTSTSQSKGIFSTANNLVGAVNTRALATPSLAANSQLKEMASAVAASAGSAAKTGSSATVISGVTSRNNIKSDETVVESITLNDQKPAVARADSASSSSQNTRTPASETRALPSGNNNTGGSTPPAAGLNTSGSDSAAQVNPYSSGPQASLGSTTQNAQRQPANVQRGSTANSGSNTVSKEEVITYISQGDFNRTKQRLRDPNFARQLEMQSITVLDLYGNSIGAKRGDVIFLEKEDRFVRQK